MQYMENILLVVEQSILIRYYSETGKTGALYKSIDQPAWRTADNLPSSNWLGVYYQTVPELTVCVHLPPGAPIWQQFGFDMVRDEK